MRTAEDRLRLSRRAFLSAFAALLGRLGWLQLKQREPFVAAADQQRLRLLREPADRGVIYDIKGRPLVRNVPSYNVVMVRSDLPEDPLERQRVLERASAILAIPIRAGQGPSLERLIQGASRLPMLEPIVLRRDVGAELAHLIEQQQHELPGIRVQRVARRQYLYGELLAHILGYVGPIPPDKVEAYLARGYELSDVVGLAGLEHTYEALLRGSPAEQLFEVDVFGRKVRALGQPRAALPGANLVLNIDVDLQEAATVALRQGLERKGSPGGAVVALDPRDGSVRAMVSLPSFDNNIFTIGAAEEEIIAALQDPTHRLLNRAISGGYPPGSTFKIVTASAALQEGVIGAQTTRHCAGIMYVTGNDGVTRYPFYCFNRAGHGSVNVVAALRHSCDIFFYQIAGGFEDFKGLGQKRLVKYAEQFGLGALTGVDLPGEFAGLIPTPTWKRLTKHELWFTGDTYNCAIGQGDILVTPLQLACATMAVANGGALWQPRLAHSLIDSNGAEIARFKPRLLRQVPVAAENLQLVRQGMREAVVSGTARQLKITEVPVAGKTGTAEFYGPRDAAGHLPTHAWFTCFAPYDNPEIVVTVLLEQSGEGAFYAVPVAAEVLRAYFGLNSGSSAK